MFDIGWTEMLVIAVVMIVVVGPKDLPRMLRTFGKTAAKLRAMAGDFQKQFNDALKEAELDDVKKSVDQLRGLNPANEIRKQLNPFEKAAAEVRSGLDKALRPAPPPATPAAEPQPAEALKNGATAMPGVAGPETMPAAPVMTPLDGAAGTAQPPAVTTPGEQPNVAAGAVAAVEPATPARAAPRKAAAAKPPPKRKTAATNGTAAAGKTPAKPKVVAAKASSSTKSAAPKAAAKKPKADAE
jgi:sec-independent protein translocase protein TatB